MWEISVSVWKMCVIMWDVCISVWKVPDLRICVHEYSNRMHAHPWPSMAKTAFSCNRCKKTRKYFSCRKAITCDIPKMIGSSLTPTNCHDNSNVGLYQDDLVDMS